MARYGGRFAPSNLELELQRMVKQPVVIWKQAWVQPNPAHPYKVYKWVRTNDSISFADADEAGGDGEGVTVEGGALESNRVGGDDVEMAPPPDIGGSAAATQPQRSTNDGGTVASALPPHMAAVQGGQPASGATSMTSSAAASTASSPSATPAPATGEQTATGSLSTVDTPQPQVAMELHPPEQPAAEGLSALAIAADSMLGDAAPSTHPEVASTTAGSEATASLALLPSTTEAPAALEPEAAPSASDSSKPAGASGGNFHPAPSENAS